MEPLQPEIGRVITELRWMLLVERRVETGMRLLDELQAHVSGGPEVPVVDVQLSIETRELL
jgi:hypothetical protein